METIKKTSKIAIWVSYVLQGIVVIMFLMGATFNLSQTEEAVTGATSFEGLVSASGWSAKFLD